MIATILKDCSSLAMDLTSDFRVGEIKLIKCALQIRFKYQKRDAW